jgi:hypothetical protein
MDNAPLRGAGQRAHESRGERNVEPTISRETLQGIHALRPASEIPLDAGQQARLLLIARGDPPHGWTRWTLPRLAEELVSQGIVATISPEHVRQALVEAIMGKEPEVSPIEENEQCWF